MTDHRCETSLEIDCFGSVKLASNTLANSSFHYSQDIGTQNKRNRVLRLSISLQKERISFSSWFFDKSTNNCFSEQKYVNEKKWLQRICNRLSPSNQTPKYNWLLTVENSGAIKSCGEAVTDTYTTKIKSKSLENKVFQKGSKEWLSLKIIGLILV